MAAQENGKLGGRPGVLKAEISYQRGIPVIKVTNKSGTLSYKEQTSKEVAEFVGKTGKKYFHYRNIHDSEDGIILTEEAHDQDW